MTTTRSEKGRRLPSSAILMHWLILVSGLALLTAVRLDELDKMAPLWMGSVLGTALGQAFSARRMRLWLFVFIVGNLMWLAPLTMVPIWPILGIHPWASVEMFVMALAPAALAGYLSLSERGALLAFWFPAVPWMVALLDRSRGVALEGGESWLLLGALAVLLLGLLRARETRRVALWRAHAVTRLAAPAGEAVLRQAPLGRAGQLAWMAVVGAATLALTGWLAPKLWQHDDLDDTRRHGAGVAGYDVADRDFTCCDELSKVEQKKVKEYLPIARPRDTKAHVPGGAACVVCRNGLPVQQASVAAQEPGHQVITPDPIPVPGAPLGGIAPSTGGTAAPEAPIAAPAAVPLAPTASPPAPRANVPAIRPGRAARLSGVGRATFIAPPATRLDGLAWVLALGISAALVQLVSRPLRRLVVLRHLEKPLWPETVDQRVSNLWHWMLVGLRDAGFQPAPGERPQELAARVGIPGMTACATVLERARHGVRVDGEDLKAMESATRAVVRAARDQAGAAARAASWLRWPLV